MSHFLFGRVKAKLSIRIILDELPGLYQNSLTGKEPHGKPIFYLVDCCESASYADRGPIPGLKARCYPCFPQNRVLYS